MYIQCIGFVGNRTAGRLLNPPDHLQLLSGNESQNVKRFKQKWSKHELAIEIAKKEGQFE